MHQIKQYVSIVSVTSFVWYTHFYTGLWLFVQNVTYCLKISINLTISSIKKSETLYRVSSATTHFNTINHAIDLNTFNTLQGQFRNDSFNGQGTMEHCSGMLYEGLWINGHPANMASKLVITNTTPVEVTQGEYFEITVECQNDINTATQGKNPQFITNVTRN